MTRHLARLLEGDAVVAAAQHAVALLLLPSSFSDAARPRSPGLIAALRCAANPKHQTLNIEPKTTSPKHQTLNIKR